MGKATRFAIAFTSLWLTTLITAQEFDLPEVCPCYTATTWVADTGCPAFKPSPPCIFAHCMMLSTTTIPGPNKYCPKTLTATSYLPCQTACRAGCATYTSTEMASPSCLPTSIPTSIPNPTVNPNPIKPTLMLTLTTKPKPTITPPPRSRPCYTETVTASNKCPEDDLGCPPPDCIWLSTTFVSSGPVEGCCTTPTLTRSRSCKGGCNGACATQWVTETATGWSS